MHGRFGDTRRLFLLLLLALGVFGLCLANANAEKWPSWKGWSPWDPDRSNAAQAQVLSDQIMRGKAILDGVKQAALRGNVTDMNLLGRYFCFLHDYPKAVYWYRLSAMKGNPEGEYELGYFLAVGPDVPHNLARAIVWLRKAKKNAYAASTLAYLHSKGIGFPKSPSTALRDYIAAAKDGSEGSGQAASTLAKMYRDGTGGAPKDAQKAAYWERYGKRVQYREVGEDMKTNAAYCPQVTKFDHG